MLKGTSHQPDKVVGRMRPTSFREFWEYTVEKVAVNAVMAGAKPGDLAWSMDHSRKFACSDRSLITWSTAATTERAVPRSERIP